MRTIHTLVKYCVVLFSISTLSGCAMMFAQREMPDSSKVVMNASREVVERELGSPISEVKAGMGRSGERRCVYKVLVKAGEHDPSTMDTVVDSFVGFRTYEYTIIYDKNSRVIRLKQVAL